MVIAKKNISVEQFLVQITLVPGKSKLTCGPARLHLQNKSFCLVTGLPPKIAGHWNLSHLRKFGVVDGKFCFQGGTQCLKGTFSPLIYVSLSRKDSNYFSDHGHQCLPRIETRCINHQFFSAPHFV